MNYNNASKEIQEMQDKAASGEYDEAGRLALELLKTDPYNFKVLDLFCKTLEKQKNPKALFDFLIDNNVDYSKINTGTLIIIVELLNCAEIKADYWNLSNRIMSVIFQQRTQ